MVCFIMARGVKVSAAKMLVIMLGLNPLTRAEPCWSNLTGLFPVALGRAFKFHQTRRGSSYPCFAETNLDSYQETQDQLSASCSTFELPPHLWGSGLDSNQ